MVCLQGDAGFGSANFWRGWGGVGGGGKMVEARHGSWIEYRSGAGGGGVDGRYFPIRFNALRIFCRA